MPWQQWLRDRKRIYGDGEKIVRVWDFISDMMRKVKVKDFDKRNIYTRKHFGSYRRPVIYANECIYLFFSKFSIIN